MNITYYKDNRLTYASRNRYRDISNATILGEEIQKSVLLGDGANTSIKTKVSNICDYVTIDNTRWFVTSYTYLNGGQVVLNLQRDVIGEFGIQGMYGKIERGYTDGILKYKKELSLNQILKRREKLLPSTNQYGKYLVDNHDNEMWGIFYLVKPNKINPETGQPYEDKLDIPIPGLTPTIVDYDFIDTSSNNVYYSYIKPADENEANCVIRTTLRFSVIDDIYNPNSDFKPTVYMDCGCYFVIEDGVYKLKTYANETSEKDTYANFYIQPPEVTPFPNTLIESIANSIMYNIGSYILSHNSNFDNKYVLPQILETSNIPSVYNNVTIKNNDKYYHYTSSNKEITKYGTNVLLNDEEAFKELFSNWDNFIDVSAPTSGRFIGTSTDGQRVFYLFNDKQYMVRNYVEEGDTVYSDKYFSYSYNYYTESTLSSKEISSYEAGVFTIDLTQQLIDEPYNIVVMPLYDVKIYDKNNQLLYTVEKDRAFSVFNTIIQYLSGDNPYLVDAQIYPYCPVLVGVSSTVGNYPIFSINSTSYTVRTEINLYPNNDVKKEYIETEYNIVAPDQSGTFTFKYYDYKNGNGNNNSQSLIIDIKTALKPFAIISSAVIVRDENCLKGLYHATDLTGCQPSSNGFECSLSSNAFETYKRNNSNYQAIFNKQMEKMELEHSVERANDIVASVVNTVSAATMGGIAGAAVADAGIFNSPINRGVGAAFGAGLAGATVGTAMGIQSYKNEQLREYERSYERTMFDLNIGTVKNIPNSVNRISSFNELIIDDFCYVVETYTCSNFEERVVDDFIKQYGYEIGVYDFLFNYNKEGWFLRGEVIKSNLIVNLHMIAKSELSGGVYIYAEI